MSLKLFPAPCKMVSYFLFPVGDIIINEKLIFKVIIIHILYLEFVRDKLCVDVDQEI